MIHKPHSKKKFFHRNFKINLFRAKITTVPTVGHTGTGGNDNDNANRITYDEFAILVRRIDRMEYSIGNIVSRVKRIFVFFYLKNSIF